MEIYLTDYEKKCLILTGKNIFWRVENKIFKKGSFNKNAQQNDGGCINNRCEIKSLNL